jgi:hypothetical protein
VPWDPEWPSFVNIARCYELENDECDRILGITNEITAIGYNNSSMQKTPIPSLV